MKATRNALIFDQQKVNIKSISDKQDTKIKNYGHREVYNSNEELELNKRGKNK